MQKRWEIFVTRFAFYILDELWLDFNILLLPHSYSFASLESLSSSPSMSTGSSSSSISPFWNEVQKIVQFHIHKLSVCCFFLDPPFWHLNDPTTAHSSRAVASDTWKSWLAGGSAHCLRSPRDAAEFSGGGENDDYFWLVDTSARQSIS